MATELERLIVRIEADTGKLKSELRQGVRSAEQATGRMGRAFDGLKRRLGNAAAAVFSFRGALVAVAGATALGLVARRSIEAADSIGKVADKVGLTTDSLQELRFAADQAGVNTTTLDMAMQRFSRRVGEAAKDSGELKDTLIQYGIEVKNADGTTRALDAVLGDLADAMANAGSEQEALRIAFKAFDSEGAALVNLLRDGAVSLEQMRQKARDMGIVLNESLIREAEDAADQLSAMDAQIKANATRLAVNLTPVLLAASQMMASFSDAVVRGREELRAFLLTLPDELQPPVLAPESAEERQIDFKRMQDEASDLRVEIDALDKQIQNLLDRGTDDNPQTFTPLARVEQLLEKREQLQNRLTELNRELLKDVETPGMGQPFQGVTEGADEAAAAIVTLTEAQQDQLATARLALQAAEARTDAEKRHIRQLELREQFKDFPDESREELVHLTLQTEALAEEWAEVVKHLEAAAVASGLAFPSIGRATGRGQIEPPERPEELGRTPIERMEPIRAEQNKAIRDFIKQEKQAQAIIQAQLDGLDEIVVKLQLRQQFPLVSEQEIERITRARLETQKLGDALENNIDITDELKEASAEFARDFSREVSDALLDSERSFEDFKDAVLRIMAEIAVQRLIAQPIARATGSLLDAVIGGAISGITSSAASTGGTIPAIGGTKPFAEGGTIRVGGRGLVGEAGPELAIARPMGTEIIPLRAPQVPAMSRGGGGGINVTINQAFDFRNADGDTVARLDARADMIKSESVSAAVQEVRAQVLSGGTYSRDIGKRD